MLCYRLVLLQPETTDCGAWISFRVTYEMVCVDAVPVRAGHCAIDIVALRENGDLVLVRGTMLISRLTLPTLATASST